MNAPVVWWLVEGRHELTTYNAEQRTYDTKCGLTLPAADDESDVTTIRPPIACGRCLTADARRNIEATRAKHAGNTTKPNANRYT